MESNSGSRRSHGSFARDIDRYLTAGRGAPKIYLLFEQGLWAVAVYRFGKWVRTVRIPVVSTILKAAAFLAFKLTEVLTGISLPASASIGPGLYLGHFGPTIVHSSAVIGEGCSLGPGVVIGTRGLGSGGAPQLGNDVYVGVGAKILGPVVIGDGARIGANAVVLSSVPDGATAVGVPARILDRPAQDVAGR